MKMQTIAKVSVALFALCLPTGCMHTVVGGPGGNSPDGKYKVHIESHGRSAHAYTDYTVKKVGISIDEASAQKQVFGRWAVLEAADLCSKCTWQDTSSLRISFFQRKSKSRPELDRGFVLIRRGSDGGFRVIEHSKNVQIKARNYFF
jgi:hypothetical protein